MPSNGHDLASTIGIVVAAPKATATAGGTGDATLVHGTAIDVTALNPPAGSSASEGNCRYESVCFALAGTATLADTKALNLTASIETCAASGFGSGVVTLVATAAVIGYTSAGGGTYQLVGKIGCSLENALQYIRVSFTPDLTASGTDVSDIQALAIFGGAGETP